VQRTASISRVTIALVAIGIGVAGCGSSSSSSKNASGTSAASNTSAATTSAKPQSKVAPRTFPAGPNPTIASYIQQSGITETPVHRGDPGAPAITLPIPDGWADAGPDTPAAAYWAIIDNGPEAAKYTPSIVATVSKLVGNVDQQKLLDLAAGELKNLPGFKAMGDESTTTFANFHASQLGGIWTQGGQTKAIAQKTVVIPGSDAVYLLRLSADCLDNQIDQALPATITIDDKATIAL
jgi:Probable lipoprotein LpqN